MPLDEVRIERVERSEQLDGGLDQPAEQHDPEAEVGRRDGRRAVTGEQRLDATPGPPAQPVVAMTKLPATGIQARRQVGGHGVAPRGLDDEARAGKFGGIVPADGRSPDEPHGLCLSPGLSATPCQRGGLHRTTQRAVTEDHHRVHLVVPSCAKGRRRTKVQGMKKPRSPSWCRGPWSLRSLEAPVRRVDAPSEPQGPCLPAGPPELLLGLFREDSAVHIEIVAHNVELMQTFPRGERAIGARDPLGRRLGLRPAPPGDTYRRCPIAVTVREAPDSSCPSCSASSRS